MILQIIKKNILLHQVGKVVLEMGSKAQLIGSKKKTNGKIGENFGMATIKSNC